MKQLIKKFKQPSGPIKAPTGNYTYNVDTVTVNPEGSKNKPYEGDVQKDDIIKEFYEQDYLPRFKRENPNATEEEIAALNDKFDTTINSYKNEGMGGLSSSEGILWKSSSGETPRYVIAHELMGHQLRQYGLGKLAGSQFSADNLGKYDRTNWDKFKNFLGLQGSGSGYSAKEADYLLKGWSNFRKRRFGETNEENQKRRLYESGAINTQTRYRIWRSLRAQLGRTPTLDETDNAIRTMPKHIKDQFIQAGDMYTNELMNPNTNSKNGYLGGIEDYNALDNSLIHVAQNDTQEEKPLTYTAKQGGRLLIKKRKNL